MLQNLKDAWMPKGHLRCQFWELLYANYLERKFSSRISRIFTEVCPRTFPCEMRQWNVLRQGTHHQASVLGIRAFSSSASETVLPVSKTNGLHSIFFLLFCWHIWFFFTPFPPSPSHSPAHAHTQVSELFLFCFAYRLLIIKIYEDFYQLYFHFLKLIPLEVSCSYLFCPVNLMFIFLPSLHTRYLSMSLYRTLNTFLSFLCHPISTTSKSP